MKLCRRRLKERNERAFAIVLFAVFLTMLLGSAGLAIDLGSWYWNIQRAQRAADSAALAGAVYLPEDAPTAESEATSVLTNNGFDVGDVVYAGPYPTRPAYMQVKLQGAVPSSFLQFFGYSVFHFHVQGIASYRPPLAMGSPDNVLGREPSSFPKWGTHPGVQQFTLGQNSKAIDKSYADRWDTQPCAGGTPSTPPDNCSGGLNSEYQPGGRNYSVVVEPGTTGTLAIEVYDPLFANTDTTCIRPPYVGLAAAWGGPLPVNYESYATNPEVCAGDWGTAGDEQVRITVSTPSNAPGGSQIINSGLQCAPRYYDPLPAASTAATWASMLKQPVSSIYDTIPANTFHKWTRVCDIPIGATFPPGEYTINVDFPNPGTTQMHNYYMLRAAMLDGTGNVDAAETTKVSLHAIDKLIAVINSQGFSNLSFYAVKLGPNWAGDTFHFQGYDLGDTVLTSIKFDFADGRQFDSCVMSFPDGQVPSKSSPSGCSFDVTGMSDTFNSRVVDFGIKVPDDFTCVEGTDSCWVRLSVAYEHDQVTDGASWSVLGPGAPVALYNEKQLS